MRGELDPLILTGLQCPSSSTNGASGTGLQSGRGGHTKGKVAKVTLDDVGWTKEHSDCFETCKRMIGSAALLAHPDPTKHVCVFTDASDLHWGAVISQVSMDIMDKPVEDQDHAPLMFVSGTFSGAASRWAIVEMEAYAVVETLRRGDYLLHRPGGFDLYTDHANLKFIFNPASINAAVPKYTAAKLDPWALLLMGYDYRIRDIAGDDNVWADLLSRWGSTPTICAIFRVPLKAAPLEDPNFVWPTLEEIKQLPDVAVQERSQLLLTQRGNDVWITESGVVWVLQDVTQMQVQLFVVAHFGIAGHRGVETTLQRLKLRFWWHGMAKDVKFFVARYLHCASAQGRVQRPFGEVMHASKRNELLQLGFLAMPDGFFLVIKDDASKYLLLWETMTADAHSVVRALLHWFSLFGVAYCWVTDQGSHFKNTVLTDLQHLAGGEASFHDSALSMGKWYNGKRHETSFASVSGAVFGMENGTEELARVGSSGAVDLQSGASGKPQWSGACTSDDGFAVMSPLDSIAVPGRIEPTTLAAVLQLRKLEFEKLQAALDGMHQETAMVAETKRRRGRASRNLSTFSPIRAGRFRIVHGCVGRTTSKVA